jgi:hypothetical protein
MRIFSKSPAFYVKAAGCFLAFLSSIFFDIFALDAQGTVELVVHLIPGIIVLGAAYFAWYNPGFGAPLLLLLGIVATFHFESYLSLSLFLLISAPLFGAGILILISLALRDA